MRIFVMAIAIFLFSHPLYAQLTADFTMDKAAGCSPLMVSFQNTTGGASANAVYSWNFGNGNSSLLPNAGAVFIDEKAYSVTLTVTDGGNTSVRTKTITVYKKPTIDFLATPVKGCMPLPVNFTATATAGDGSISRYYWDFGDGFTQPATNAQVTHTYNVVQIVPVSVTVTNSFGCASTLSKNDVVDVKPSLLASFTANKRVLCRVTDSVYFTNTSSGPGLLSYLWEFGDGSTATTAAPGHAFNRAGFFTVKLTVTSSEGCTAVSTQTDYLNVASFTSDFNVPAVVCRDSYILYNNSSTPITSNATWLVDAMPVYTYNNHLQYAFNTTGLHTITLKNTFGTCRDSVTKQVVVQELPKLNGFLIEPAGLCGSPVVVQFRDTTASAVRWEWNFGWSQGTSSAQAPVHTFTRDDDFYVQLLVANAAGCSAYISKPLVIRKPLVTITSPDVLPNGQVSVCGSMNVRFAVNTTETITSYNWNFGDNSSSTLPNPQHLYSVEGYFPVTLNFVTSNGCTGTTSLYRPVTVRIKPRANFTASSTNICGNTPFQMINTSIISPLSGANGYYYNWHMGNSVHNSYAGQSGGFTHQYFDSGVYTIRLIITDLVCADTITKVNYIKVLPPFPKIASFTNTCAGTRGLVTFTETSKYTDNWHWDFGDGNTQSFTTRPVQVQHLYAQTGIYKAVLTTTNAQCTVKDSVLVRVLLKQSPVLSLSKYEICNRDDYLIIKVGNLEKNTFDPYYFGYGFSGWQHRDGSYAYFNGYNPTWTDTSYTLSAGNFMQGKEGLRVTVYSGALRCADTSNWVPLKIKGPLAGFKINTRPCATGKTVFLQDTSRSVDGAGIVSGQWNFGDGYLQNLVPGAEVSHVYAWPSSYNVTLTVTDSDGCKSVFQRMVTAENNDLRSVIATSATTVSPGTTVLFTNLSVSTDPANTTYKWKFGDGTESVSFHAFKTYTQPGTYNVQLIATNLVRGCADTATVVIKVKYVNAAFSFNSSFLTTAKCPPVLVQFTNTSYNVSRIHWDFGDGKESTQFNPSHIFTQAGKYIITVKTYSDNGTVYTTLDSIDIKIPTATLAADTLKGCAPQAIALTSLVKDATAYWWDFGDGNLQPATGGAATHFYRAAGVYNPRLYLQDANGCTASVKLPDNITIDSLSVSLGNLPATICTPRQITFDPVINSVVPQQQYTFKWSFGTTNPADTSALQRPVFNFTQPGNYLIRLRVSSSFGCTKETTHTLAVYQGLGGGISGPAAICEGADAQFTGTTILPGQPQWQWFFHDGATANQQLPPVKKYLVPGVYPVRLLVNNNGCVDSITHTLTVHAKPTGVLAVKLANLCKGSSMSIVATGGDTYSWGPALGLNVTSGNVVVASPNLSTTFKVQVTNQYGCSNSDSIKITVIPRLQLQLTANQSVCKGEKLQLVVTGAGSYKWINNTASLSNPNVPNPIATPLSNTVYTITGTDAYNCFSDTANINVVVRPLPTVTAGADAEIVVGTSHQLSAVSSNDVNSWRWTPPKYLDCNDCPAPKATPMEPMDYVVTVKNNYGCRASDTVSIKLLCREGRIFIPNAFTPNNDGNNDVFTIRGSGIKLVRSFIIFNRWGEPVFERSNFLLGDRNASWDGKYKGMPVAPGTYVYIANLTCNENNYTQKGVVTVVY